jgi:hypothetical protein
MSNPNKDRVFSIEFPDNPGIAEKEFFKLSEEAFDLAVKFLRIFWQRVAINKSIEHIKLCPRFFSIQAHELNFGFKVVLNELIAGKMEITGNWEVPFGVVTIDQSSNHSHSLGKKAPEQAVESIIEEIAERFEKLTKAKQNEKDVLQNQAKTWKK